VTRRAPALVGALALAVAGCLAPAPSGTPARVPPSTEPSAALGPAVLGRDWAKVDLVDAGDGDATQTTPPYENPGSLGHPQAYQGGQADLLDVVNGPLGLIAVGWLSRDFQADAWHSSDGTTWVRSDGFPAADSSMAMAVAEADGGGALAVGSAGIAAAAWRSADGATWTAVDDPSFHDDAQLRLSAVVPWHDGYIVAGHLGGLIGPNRAAFWTVDASGTWSRVPDGPVMADARVTDLAVAADGSLVAVGVAGDAKTAIGAIVWRSTDGRRWSRTGDAAALDGALMSAVTVTPSGLVAVGYDLASTRAVVWRSPDGTSWTPVPDAPALGNFGLKIEMHDVAWTPAGLVAGGHYLFGTQFPAAAVWTSADGLAWTRVPDVAAFSQGKVQGVTAGGPGMVAVGNYGSPDFSIPTVWVSPGR
jgi:hypothetical protein